MPADFLMPKLGLTMEEGTIIDWLVDDGADVAQGTPILLIETDKTETEVEAPATGRIQQAGDVGATFRCGDVIGHILGDGEKAITSAAPERPATQARVDSTPAASSPPADLAASLPSPSDAGGRLLASPNARRVATELGVDVARVRGTGPGGRITSEDVTDQAASLSATPTPRAPSAAQPIVAPSGADGPPASIAARQLADLLGVSLADVPIDPAERRVTRDGVAHYVRGRLAGAAVRPPEAPPVAAAVLADAAQTPTSVVRMSGMRGRIAKRMHASLQEMAQLTLTMDADMDAVVAHRTALRGSGNAPGYTDYVIAATALALREHPRLNAQVTADGIALLGEIHVGMAVALDEGLIVPVVHHTDQLSLAEIAESTSRLAAAARAGELTPDDVAGGTFSVTALGMFGVDSFTPVINPPNVAILGVGRIRNDVVLVNGHVDTTARMTLSLTWDHRVVDGAPAAEFTKSVCIYLNDPDALV